MIHAGDPTLDLVNTVAWRLDPTRRDDRLPTGAALAAWLTAAGIETPARDALWWAKALDPVLDLRERLARVLIPLATSVEPDFAELRGTFTAAMRRAELTGVVPPKWTVSVRGPRDVAGLLAVRAVGFFGEVDVSRLRQCADGGCGWLFLDHSRNRSRRWCDSADCGNRDRVRRHYRRSRAARDAAEPN